MDSFYKIDELEKMGFQSIGKNVYISRKVSLYSIGNINIGSNVRIDDFCILSGKITLGNNVHIAAGTYIYGGDVGITLDDYSCLSSRCAVYAISDDYSGEFMSNPMIPDRYRNVKKSSFYIGGHALIGTACKILPGVRIGNGASMGAMSLVNHDLEEFTINVGIPCRKLKDRSRRILELQENLEQERDNDYE